MATPLYKVPSLGSFLSFGNTSLIPPFRTSFLVLSVFCRPRSPYHTPSLATPLLQSTLLGHTIRIRGVLATDHSIDLLVPQFPYVGPHWLKVYVLSH